jgi:transcriptional regulator GlxA family with amidase domain
MAFTPSVHPSACATSPGSSSLQVAPRPACPSSHREIVTRAVSLLRRHIGEPISIALLSRMAGVSDRTLRSAFHDVLGLSPKRYATWQRLQAARDALAAADPRTTTVTDIATSYGFFELGRFAGQYRHAFGEVPSRTLHHVEAARPGRAA